MRPPSGAKAVEKTRGAFEFYAIVHRHITRVGVQICDSRHIHTREGLFMRTYAHGAI